MALAATAADQPAEAQAIRTEAVKRTAFTEPQAPAAKIRPADRVAAALRQYATFSDRTPLTLMWWTRPYPGNYGDWLSPLLFSRVTGRPVNLEEAPARTSGAPCIVGLGSIAKFADDKTVVAGSGASAKTARLDPAARYVSVRGPYTADILKVLGGPDLQRFGDPALALREVFPAERGRTNGRIALVRHTAHAKLPVLVDPLVDEISILCSRAEELRAFVSTIQRYDAVITSAMHVYITCQVYGIPVSLVTFEGSEKAVAGDGMKYRDYAAGAGVPEVIPAVVGLDLRQFRGIRYTDAQVSDAVRADVAAAIREASEIFDEL